jgi:hypothetical protein
MAVADPPLPLPQGEAARAPERPNRARLPKTARRPERLMATPLADEKRTTILIRNLIQSESERWRTIQKETLRRTSRLSRLLDRISDFMQRL